MVILILTLAFILYLAAEGILHQYHLNNIPLRITVSGTRGKSSIVRTLASVFRSAGLPVLAKTTGSEALMILPDGTEEPVKRNGRVSIIEQKKVVARASRMKVSCLISEIMSIQPENHQVETTRLLKPHLTILSNFRADHTDVAGESALKIARILQHDVISRSTIILPESEASPSVMQLLRKHKPDKVLTSGRLSDGLDLPAAARNRHFSNNLDLVICAARHQGITDETIREGILNVRLDIGETTCFSFSAGTGQVIFVNVFAANDPQSTSEIIDDLRMRIPLDQPEIVGLLALRSDRGERSVQWMHYLRDRKPNLFQRLFVVGPGSRVLERKVPGSVRIPGTNPTVVTNQIIRSASRDRLVFGIGNLHGPGMNLLTYWKANGSETPLNR